MSGVSKALLIAGLLCVAATIVVALLLIPMPMWALTLALPALVALCVFELILFGGFVLIERWIPSTSRAFARAGATTVLVICSIAGIIASIALFCMPITACPILASIDIVLVVVLVIGIGAFIVAGRRIGESEDGLQAAVEANARRRARIQAIAAQCSDQRQREELIVLADNVRFSDNAIVTMADIPLDEAIAQVERVVGLGQAGAEEMAAAIENLDEAIEARNRETTMARRGGF